jgi:retron-type reverse transcriptase
MPKRFGRLYEQICTPEALYAAYLTGRKGKRSSLSVAHFECNLGAELTRLHNELASNTYKPKPYRRFWVYEPKPRIIAAPAFRDVVVQHAIYKLIYPIFDKTFIHDSYGCRVGKGTHRAADQAQQFLRQSVLGSYTLQLDIKKFYYSIDRTILMQQIEKKIKDPRMLQLLEAFIQDEGDKGVPIGNLLSQLFALVYLNPLDHYIKRELKVQRYVRYVDDFVIFGVSKEEAAQLRDTIAAWLHENLGLELSRWTIQPVSRGINFVGFRTYRATRTIRRHSLHNFGRALRAGRIDSLLSIMGNAKQSASYQHLCNRLINEYPEHLRGMSRRMSDELLQLYKNNYAWA